MKRIFSIFSLLFILAACSSTGVYVDESKVQNFTKGETTYESVISQLGQPTQKTLDSEGNLEIAYLYSETSVRPETFIPYAGAFVGGADTRTNSTTFIFDSSGILQDYKTSSMQLGTAQNLSSDAKFDRVETKGRE